jgi:hypothetical protein
MRERASIKGLKLIFQKPCMAYTKNFAISRKMIVNMHRIQLFPFHSLPMGPLNNRAFRVSLRARRSGHFPALPEK